MGKTIKIGTVTTEEILKIEARIRREREIAEGRINYNRVEKSKKTYSRKGRNKFSYEY